MLDVVIRNLYDAFGMGVWIIDRDDNNHVVRVLRPVEFKWQEYAQGHLLPEPTIAGRTAEVEMIFEKFIEQVKEAGYGRDKLSIESGELKATREHLADMKKLVFTPPPHFTPILMGNVTSGLSMLGHITPGRAWYSTPDVLTIRKDRVRAAAGNCAQTKIVLKTLFPEAFDETD